MKPKRPRIFAGPASHYASAHETIREISNGALGCLLSVRNVGDDGMRIEVYRADPGITVISPSEPPMPPKPSHFRLALLKARAKAKRDPRYRPLLPRPSLTFPRRK